MEKKSYGVQFVLLSEWIIRIAYLNILWSIFTMIGGVIFGVGPATTGLFAVLRQMMLKGVTEVKVFQSFWEAYKAEFKNSNIVFYILLFSGFLLYFYTYFLQIFDGPSVFILRYLILVLFLIYLFSIIYIYPLLVHYKMTVKQYLKTGFFLSITQPLTIGLILIGCFVNFFLLRLVPGLIPFFGLSSFAIIIMYPTMQLFMKMENKDAEVIE